MAKAKFAYRAPDAAKIKEHSEQSGGSFDSIIKSGFDMFKPKNGENTIRILPPTYKDFDYWGLEIWVHNRIGSDESSYLCPAKMRNKACPICDAAAEAGTAGEKEEKRQLQANKRFLVWLIDRDEKKPMPLAYSMSWSMDRDITALVHNKKSGKLLLIDHPDDGMDVTFSKSGAGLKTKYYGYQIERETSPISDNERRQDEILNYIKENPLDEILNIYSADYLSKILEGKAEKKDELDEDDEKPKKRRVADDDDEKVEEQKKRKARDADDAEDDADAKPKSRRRAADDDDEEEEVKPKRKRPAADEDEEEETPRPRKRDAEDNDEEAEARPRSHPPRRKPVEADDEDDEPAPKKKRRVADDDDEKVEEQKKRKARDADDAEDDEPAPKRRKPVEDDEDEYVKPAKRVRAK